jgi:hypothetical protein
MTDTPPEVKRIMREKLMALSGEERFVIGAEMFESAREMIKASLPADLSEAQRLRELFRRTYGKEVNLHS